MRFFLNAVLLMLALPLCGQDVMMQGWYWDYPKTKDGFSFVDSLGDRIAEIQDAGITQLWLPPLSRASFGNGSNGYDPKDLYDLGEFGLGPTGFGTRSQLDQLIQALNTAGITPIADVVYNHRDGGRPENNGAVEGWIENYNSTKVNAGDQPYPSDRVRYILPLGGTTGNGTGTYYFKIRSASQHPNFHDRGYKFYVQTNTTGFQNNPAIQENEPNGGGNCGEPNNPVPLGVDMVANVDALGCGIDEFAVTLSANDFNPAGDTLFIYMNNTNGGYSDHYVFGLYYDGRMTDIQNEIVYQTYTDFTQMPSGLGAMNYLNFKPNGNPTNLGGDWDEMLFFYDYDQFQNDTRDKLSDWTKWLWTDVGIRGLRMDAVKHFAPSFVGDLLDALHDAGQDHEMVVGEFFDTNGGNLKAWVDGVEASMDADTKAAMDVAVFDFELRAALEAASDAFGYDVRDVFESGIVDKRGGNPKNVVTFANNHDYRDAFQAIDNDPLLAYAYLLTNREVGQPTVFYPDYFGIPLPHGPSDTLGTDIKRINKIYNAYIHGGQIDYLNNKSTPASITYNSGFANTSLIYQSYGGGTGNAYDAIMVINYAGGTDTLDVDFPLTSNSIKGPGTIFRDFTGKALTPEVTADASNRVRVVVPPRSFAILVDAVSNSACAASTRIYVDRNATGLNNGHSWADAFENLGAALAFARRCSLVDEIWVKEGTYTSNVLGNRGEPFFIDRGLKILGGFPANMAKPRLTDRNPLLYPTVLSGNIGMPSVFNDNAYHVISNTSSDEVTLSGLVIEQGNANGPDPADKSGSAVLNAGNLKLDNVVIRNCSAENSGEISVKSGGLLTIVQAEINGQVIENLQLEGNQ